MGSGEFPGPIFLFYSGVVFQFECIVHKGTSTNEERYTGPPYDGLHTVEYGLHDYDDAADDKHNGGEECPSPSASGCIAESVTYANEG